MGTPTTTNRCQQQPATSDVSDLERASSGRRKAPTRDVGREFELRGAAQPSAPTDVSRMTAQVPLAAHAHDRPRMRSRRKMARPLL